MHADLVVKMLTLSQAKEAVALSSGGTDNNIRHSDFKPVCFQRKNFGCRLSLRSHVDVLGQLAQENFVEVSTISVLQFSITATSAVEI